MSIVVKAGGQLIARVESFMSSPARETQLTMPSGIPPIVRAWNEAFFNAGEPGMININSIRPGKSTAMVVWNEEFAIDQLERMMRGTHKLSAPSQNPCREISLSQNAFRDPEDWDDTPVLPPGAYATKHTVEYPPDSPIQVEEVSVVFEPPLVHPPREERLTHHGRNQTA